MLLKLFARKRGEKWQFMPSRFFATAFLVLLFAGVCTKWFILTSIETGDFGVLAIPILGLIGNLVKDSLKKKSEV